MKYLSVEQILFLHHEAIQQFGGSSGVRDLGLIQSAAMRPQMSFSGTELYPDIFSKTAAVVESLVLNHGFVDGNKRVAAYALGMMLSINGYAFQARQGQLSTIILKIISGEFRNIEKLADWICKHASEKTQ